MNDKNTAMTLGDKFRVCRAQNSYDANSIFTAGNFTRILAN